MYASMSYQGALFNEFLITNITGIRAFTTMYVMMCYQTALMTECLITNCTAIRAFTTMCALMSYQIALSTPCLLTYCTAVSTFTTMHITGIPGFSAMYMKLFIQCTLVKTQMLNIRVYSDTKTITL
jgi:hypothetical protein